MNTDQTPPPEVTPPAGHEILTPEFLREHGAVEGMLTGRKQAPHYWEPTGGPPPTEQWEFANYLFSAPIGTIAAKLTPAPAGFRNVLPGWLAGLDTKPEELLWSTTNGVHWNPCSLRWPFPNDGDEGEFAYAVPLSQKGGDEPCATTKPAPLTTTLSQTVSTSHPVASNAAPTFDPDARPWLPIAEYDREKHGEWVELQFPHIDLPKLARFVVGEWLNKYNDGWNIHPTHFRLPTPSVPTSGTPLSEKEAAGIVAGWVCDHELKTWPEYFQPILEGKKLFEIRNNDRKFEVGQWILLREWNPGTKEYTGRATTVEVLYITDWQQSPGQVVLSISAVCGTPRKSRSALERELASVAAQREQLFEDRSFANEQLLKETRNHRECREALLAAQTRADEAEAAFRAADQSARQWQEWHEAARQGGQVVAAERDAALARADVAERERDQAHAVFDSLYGDARPPAKVHRPTAVERFVFAQYTEALDTCHKVAETYVMAVREIGAALGIPPGSLPMQMPRFIGDAVVALQAQLSTAQAAEARLRGELKALADAGELIAGYTVEGGHQSADADFLRALTSARVTLSTPPTAALPGEELLDWLDRFPFAKQHFQHFGLTWFNSGQNKWEYRLGDNLRAAIRAAIAGATK